MKQLLPVFGLFILLLAAKIHHNMVELPEPKREEPTQPVLKAQVNEPGHVWMICIDGGDTTICNALTREEYFKLKN